MISVHSLCNHQLLKMMRKGVSEGWAAILYSGQGVFEERDEGREKNREMEGGGDGKGG